MTRKQIYAIIEKDDGSNIWSHVYDVFMFCTIGFSWMMRYRCSDMGKVRAMTMHKGEIILCSDQGIYFSKSSGKSWSKRNSSERNFVDIQDMGSELIATTSDGHVYASSSGGFSWFKRK